MKYSDSPRPSGDIIQEMGFTYAVKSSKDTYLTDMFAKVFSQIFDSSIAENYQTRHVFTDLLVLADIEGNVDMTLSGISRRTNVPVEVVRKAIEELEAPDPYSRSKESDGRRIELIDPSRGWGWRIINYAHYRGLRDQESRRAYFREQQRMHRLKSKDPESVNHCQPLSTEGDGEEDLEGEENTEGLRVENSSLLVFQETWNQIEGLPKIRKLTSDRKTSLRARLKEKDWRENWQEGVRKIAQSSFCRGKNNHGWVASVDWFLRPDTLTKVLEGKYDDKVAISSVPKPKPQQPTIDTEKYLTWLDAQEYTHMKPEWRDPKTAPASMVEDFIENEKRKL